ncbi:MAG: DUF4349 domain-containing protein [Bacteroidales bacterium]|nr:DUF4349 domain-containing protein [Bacteroidales bacterium]
MQPSERFFGLKFHRSSVRLFINFEVKTTEHFDFALCIAFEVRTVISVTLGLQINPSERLFGLQLHSSSVRLFINFEVRKPRLRSLRHFGVAQCWQAQHIAVHRSKAKSERTRQLRSEIESIEGRLKYLESKVSLSTLTMTFYQIVPKETEFGHKLKNGFKNRWDTLIWFFVFLTNIWPFILIGIGLIFGFRMWRKRK